MSSVEAVSSIIIGGYSNINNKTLSKDTLDKLEKYGIDASSVSSEYEAKKLIEKAEKEKSAAEQEKNNSNQDDLYSRLKNLAQKIGITINQSENFETIFSKLSKKIDDLKGNGYGSNYNAVKSEYETLKLLYNTEIKGGSSLLSALDILGKTNKIGIGL